MEITRNEQTGEPVVTFTRHEAISYLASALHNFTVLSAAGAAQELGLEVGTMIALAAAIKDRAAFIALGVDPTELELAEITHAH